MLEYSVKIDYKTTKPERRESEQHAIYYYKIRYLREANISQKLNSEVVRKIKFF